jgi:transcriptional regulator with XRE-family HTH domain
MQEINSLEQILSKKIPIKRTARVVMTDTARVLRELRLELKLSMRALSERMDKSDSYVSQVENGRMDVPVDESLERYLAALGGIAVKTFQDRVRRYRLERGPVDRDELLEIAKRANEKQVKQILCLAKMLLASENNW